MTHSPNSISNVVVIGGGIFGTSTAVHLARRGIAVTLLNDGPLANGASGRSLAWLNSARRRTDAYHRLRLAGLERYRSLAQRRPGADWLRFDGGLTWDAAGAGNEIVQIHAHERALGYESVLLAPQEVAAALPGVAAGCVTQPGAIFNPGEGWVDLPSLIGLLAEELVRRGCRIVTDAGPAEVVVEAGRATGARSASAGIWPADAVLLATGSAVPGTVAGFGVAIADATPIALLVKTKPLAHPLRAVLNTPRVAIRPTPDGAFVLDSAWSEAEVVVHPDGRYEARSSTVEGLLREAAQVLSGAPRLEVESVRLGPKPIPGGGEPVLGELAALPGCFVAFSHSGATLGLIAGEMLADEIATGQRHPMLAPFRPERFGRS